MVCFREDLKDTRVQVIKMRETKMDEIKKTADAFNEK